MRTLVVYESIFGNTREIALAITGALSALGPARAIEVGEAPRRVGDYDLLVVGAPIHAWGMSRAGTRSGARAEAERAGVAPVSRGDGIREWLASLGPARPGQRALAFDTAVHLPALLPQGSAAGPEARHLERLGYRVLAPPEHFFVQDKDGPLDPGERDRARGWALAAVGAAGAARLVPTPAVPPAIPRRGLLLALLGFAALSALAGGGELLWWQGGSPYVPLALLDGTVFPSFLVPGLLLAGVVGGTATLATTLVARRSPRARDATLLAGGAMTVWIVAEMAQLREFSWLHALYLGLGLAVLTLGLAPGWRPDARLRWVIGVTLAEAAAFLVPTLAGLATRGGSDAEQAVVLVLAGFGEGLILGAAQARVAPVPVAHGRLAFLTGLGAAAAWLLAGVARAVGASDAVPVALRVVAIAGAAALGLYVLGAAQWVELRRHGVGQRWIAWTAAAWALALPVSLLPGLLVDEATPIASLLVLWACGGLGMGHVMALVSWRGFAGSAAPAVGAAGSGHAQPPPHPAEDPRRGASAGS